MIKTGHNREHGKVVLNRFVTPERARYWTSRRGRSVTNVSRGISASGKELCPLLCTCIDTRAVVRANEKMLHYTVPTCYITFVSSIPPSLDIIRTVGLQLVYRLDFTSTDTIDSFLPYLLVYTFYFLIFTALL